MRASWYFARTARVGLRDLTPEVLRVANDGAALKEAVDSAMIPRIVEMRRVRCLANGARWCSGGTKSVAQIHELIILLCVNTHVHVFLRLFLVKWLVVEGQVSKRSVYGAPELMLRIRISRKFERNVRSRRAKLYTIYSTV